MKNVLKISLLGVAHGLSDCAAGYMIGMLPTNAGGSLMDIAGLVLLYNLLAFGGQVPAGMVVDRVGRPKMVLVVSLCVVAAALLLFPYSPLLSITLAGIAGAFFHVSGGMMALLAFPGSTVGAGLFAAPGVMGLAFGGYMAWLNVHVFAGLAIVAAILIALVWVLEYPEQNPAPKATEKTDSLEWHDLMMLVLLLAIAMRSAVWNVFELIHGDEHLLLLALGLAAMLGKVAGGYLATRFGWRRYAVVALAVSAPLLTFGGTWAWSLLPGIFLLQSATPAAVLGMYQLMPRLPATAIGMCFGLAIAAGGIPTMLGWQPSGWMMALLIPLAAIAYWLGMKPKTKSEPSNSY